MRKLTIITLCLLLTLGFTSCRKPQKTPTDKSQTSVTSDHADVSTVNTAGGDITKRNSGEVYTGANKSEIRDILIPDDGQKIVYRVDDIAVLEVLHNLVASHNSAVFFTFGS